MIATETAAPDLARIHRVDLEDSSLIRSVLQRAWQQEITLESGLGRQLDREQAWIERLERDSLWLRTRNFDLEHRESVSLTFSLEGITYLMQSALLEVDAKADAIRIAEPSVLYRAERRERERRKPDGSARVPSRAMLRWQRAEIGDAVVIDYSVDGVSLKLRSADSPSLATAVEVRFLDGPEPETVRNGWVRRSTVPQGEEWRQIGLSITAAPLGSLIPIERRLEVITKTSGGELRDRWRMLSGSARIVFRRGLSRLGIESSSDTDVDVIRFSNMRGEQIVALCDSWRAEPGTPVIVIPPAWAKTKETLLPLARTIVGTFRRAGQPIAVLRLDGVRRRGESFKDPECRAPGRECHRMTFSQGVADIRATLDFLQQSPRFQSSRIVLVTFSGASIEARRVISSDDTGRICGWVSVVGAADLKSGLRTVSGGQDFIGGCERGVRFGIQRVLGIETDADLVCQDALDNELAHLEDARRQMARIRVPITWIQGRHDAWIDPARVREILSCGDPSERRLVEVPTGHQLRTSREALESFQLIASEIGRLVTGQPLTPDLPDLVSLEERRRAERQRLPRVSIDLRKFWCEYLLGRDGRVGMDLLTATSPYREFMAVQVEALALRQGDLVADLGSGVGNLPRFLRDEPGNQTSITMHEVDYLRDAVQAGRCRVLEDSVGPRVRYLVGDLSLGATRRFMPMKDGAYDAAIASLVLNYVDDPPRFLTEMRRVLRPGGRAVISVLRKDTDISRIYVDAASEIRAGIARGGLEGLDGEGVEESIRSFLSEAARLLDLEELGLFHFWDAEELHSLVRSSGFECAVTRLGFGNPPQAIILSATVPRGGMRVG